MYAIYISIYMVESRIVLLFNNISNIWFTEEEIYYTKKQPGILHSIVLMSSVQVNTLMLFEAASAFISIFVAF